MLRNSEEKEYRYESVVFLNEVLSLNAQESAICPVHVPTSILLNEVLSLNAQE